MPTPRASRSPAKQLAPLLLVWGDDDFAVRQRARATFQDWTNEIGGFDHETIDAMAANTSEALRALARLREAIQTLPFPGSTKLIWFQHCNFLADERAANAQAVTNTLAQLAEELQALDWTSVRLLISAGRVDRRKSFYKVLDKLGRIETLAGWSLDDKDWQDRAEGLVRNELAAIGAYIRDDALARMVAAVGPNPQQLTHEAQKLALYAGPGNEIHTKHVDAVVARNKLARAFALGDALGDRDLARTMRRLDEELWGIESDRQRSEIGLLYGLIAKVRSMLLLRGLMEERRVTPDADYNSFKTQLERIPPEMLPEDRRLNPQAMNAYMLFKALPHARRYTSEELVRAMDLLLDCNRRLVSSGGEARLALQHTLVEIVLGSNSNSAPQRPQARGA
jgi:DNA polymerase-3 subunit delta